VDGPTQALLVIMMASIMGAGIVLPLLMSGRKHLGEKLAFGPFLITSTWLVIILGQTIIDWYRRLIG